MVIRGRDEIRDAYRDDDVAAAYIAERFEHPLGAMLHARQLASLARSIAAYRPDRVLEVAPGPARLTRDVSSLYDRPGVLIDASAQMLAQARERLRTAAHPWSVVQGDGFQLPFGRVFDLVYTFRFIRHFESDDRLRLYRAIHNVLRPGGVFVFDAVNETVAKPLRSSSSYHQHYDALLRPEAIRAELDAAGFTLVQLQGVQHRFPLLYQLQVLVGPRSKTLARWAIELVDRTGGEPLEWVVTCVSR
jgi:ubiquinone/menaquinone biosynthesis C-methylase UbiE